MTVHARDLSRHTVPKIIPKIMRAVALDRFGGPEALTLHDLPTPVPDAGEVLIAVPTPGGGVWDAAIREGWSPRGRVRFPLGLGTDGSRFLAAARSPPRR